MTSINQCTVKPGTTSQIMFVNICRICLEPGEIPIFGDDEKPDISTEIRFFGGVEVNNDDELPQNICNICHELLQGAVLFRNYAKKSENDMKFTKLLEADNLYRGHPKDIGDSEYHLSDASENDTLKIVEKLFDEENCDSEDTNTTPKAKHKKSKHSNENKDSEMIMIVVSENKIETNDNSAIETADNTCEVCKMDFEASDDFYQHLRTTDHINNVKRSQKVECKVCQKSICKDYYVAHLLKHSFEPISESAGVYRCKLCDKILLSEMDVKIHKDSEIHKIFAKETNEMECPICLDKLKKVDIKSHLKNHVTELDKDEKQKCLICNKYFNHMYYYIHLKKVHNIDYTNDVHQPSIAEPKNDSKMLFVCDKCGKVFRRPSSFKLHCQTHGGELKYKCMFCPYRGLHQGLLKIHVRTHTGDYNYKCKLCSASFLTKSNLSKHLKRHKGPVDFRCSTCNRGFYSKLDLERHNEVDHLGVRKHVCNVCGKAFGYRNSMMNHQLKVHKRERLTEGKGRLPSYLQAKINENK